MPDPRLDSLLKYAVDAAAATVGPDGERRQVDPTPAALWTEIGRLQRRIDDLERTPTIQTVSGTPTQAARDGTPALDLSQPRLWLRRLGSWQFTTLT